MSEETIRNFRALSRGYRVVCFTTLAIFFPFVTLWNVLARVGGGLREGFALAMIDLRSDSRTLRDMWKAIK